MVNRRELVRQLLAGAAAGVVWPAINAAHPIYAHLLDGDVLDRSDAELGQSAWKPLLLNAQQDATLVPLAETIVPRSTEAQVNRFIDLLLSVDRDDNRKNFMASLEAIDGAAQEQFSKPFRELDEGQRVELLTRISGGSGSEEKGLGGHFENLKEWVRGAYYSSEIGMRELGWTGQPVFEQYPECRHQAGH